MAKIKNPFLLFASMALAVLLLARRPY